MSKQEQNVTGSDTKDIDQAFFRLMLPIFGVLLIWGVVFNHGLVTAFEIWYGSDIFNHCMFVLPGAFYLMYLKRESMVAQTVKPNVWVVVFCLPVIALYAVGLAGDVQLFMHAAMFALLPMLVWLVLGNRVAWQILFPLVFILFCIPVGEELVPFLQQIAAKFSVMLLDLSGVPVFRSGLYIEIPKGRFLVAEACSGISFFIASLVIGCLYAYLNIKNPVRRASFVFLSILFPVAANILRVYGIILIAHVSDMEYAVGADHLIYGWVFFAFVIICLIALGEWIREKTLPPTEQQTLSIQTATLGTARNGLFAVGVILLGTAGWLQFIRAALPAQLNHEYAFTHTREYNWLSDSASQRLPWQAKYRNATADRYLQQPTPFAVNVDIYQAFYAAGDAEMISSLNRLYDQDSWTRVETTKSDVQVHPYAMEVLSSPTGQMRLLASWFVLTDATYANQRDTKIMQIAKTLAGEPAHGGLVIVAMNVDRRGFEDQQQWFVDYVNGQYTTLSEHTRLAQQ